MMIRNTIPSSRRPPQQGQALAETMLMVPFFILLMMLLAEFGVYFYRSNLLEDTAQQVARMAARNATLSDIQNYSNEKLYTLQPQLAVLNALNEPVDAWSSDQTLQIKLTATVQPVMPISALNIFSPGTDFFPAAFTLESKKQVYVE
ncbi:MAG: hypothetical protein A3G34_00100 [Candidatus Lindowbacteria bacterium RIFCSPLOWO2_12_FULL_62_27]|nr:MAG: hypothetical protein A3G34_00100 [Candidatus Lindowbacteria bacterium RIFCSPLOWO2_12_FULL_62_27]